MANKKSDELPVDGSTEDEFPLTIEEFCIRASRNDTRVELLGAFSFVERQAGRVKDTSAEYAKRLAEFATAAA